MEKGAIRLKCLTEEPAQMNCSILSTAHKQLTVLIAYLNKSNILHSDIMLLFAIPWLDAALYRYITLFQKQLEVCSSSNLQSQL